MRIKASEEMDSNSEDAYTCEQRLQKDVEKETRGSEDEDEDEDAIKHREDHEINKNDEYALTKRVLQTSAAYANFFGMVGIVEHLCTEL